MNITVNLLISRLMAADSLFEQLKHPNPHMRDRAMREIVDTRDENTIPKLMSALGEEDVVYRRASVKTLGLIGMDSVPMGCRANVE